MNGPERPTRDVAVPVSIFAVLRSKLAEEAGELPAIHAMHAAGYQAGVDAAQSLAASGPEALAGLSERRFWSSLSQFTSRRGWGSLSHSDLHDAVGLLESRDWVESEGSETQPDATCSFTTGFLSGLLTTIAGGPIAVLEVACKGRGDDACAFAFGSEAAIHELYGQLLDGQELPAALAAL
ncbi:MAG: V4R domain-containing protein [Gemmatimonadota bacterium]